MKKIVITSTNPVKQQVVKRAVTALLPEESFEYISLDLEKDGAEPIGRKAVMSHIKEAIDSALIQEKDADFYVCMEGCMIDNGVEMNEVAYVTIRSKDNYFATSNCASFPVPLVVAEEVRKGKAFAEAVDDFFKTNGTKQGGGFVNILTGGLINKEDHYMQPTIIAFSAILKREWY